ncbi:MAG: putative metal-binding motif-containing protein [Deltaproteobacteria bacterium]|nr:putative metal-binding motif-containing protein [Deltaproteobacteria bacterium]
MASRAVFRLTLPLFVTLTALTGFTAGCQPDEYAVFLTVRTEAGVDQLTVRTIVLDPLDPRVSESVHGIGRSQEEINGDLPIRVTVELNEPHPVMVHLEGTNARGIKVVATRCYEITNEIIEDGIRLVPLANDRDGDGFVENPDEACFDANGDPCDAAYPHRCTAAIAGDCNERSAFPEEQDCDLIADGSVRVPCDRTVDPTVGCCDPPQGTYPGAPELCNDEIDQSCNQPWAPDDHGGDVACTDEDEDGFAKCSPFSVVGTCDCNDNDPDIRPMRDPETRTPCEMRSVEEQVDCDVDAPLECENGRDEDCDGADRRCDLDGDGFGSDLDCNDADATISPGATEVCTPTGGTPVDENCNGLVDELATCAPDDQDRDGSIACQVSMVAGCDCNDCDAGIRVGATEICGDGIDQDCDGLADDPCDPGDVDGDGFLAAGRDCDDTNALVYPEAPEQCDGTVDNDCDGEVDEGCGGDSDGDGWVEPAACEGNMAVSPGAAEMCDAIDNNCNTTVNEVYSTPGAASYPDGTEGCVLCPAGAAMEWCVVDITGANEATPIDTTLSFQNCGGCRNACDIIEDDNCQDGACVCTFEGDGSASCNAGDRCCSTGCEGCGDPANCGSCGNDCNAGAPSGKPVANLCNSPECIGGTCSCGSGPACDATNNEMCCGVGAAARCVRYDGVDNCGVCGNVCFDSAGNPADQDCTETSPGSGAFQCVCNGADRADCDGGTNGCETALNTVSNCDACGDRCSVRNGTPACVARVCRIDSCNPTHDDCRGGYANGCETSLRTLSDCNGCGMGCTTANATPTCASQSCEIASCNGGWGDCSGGPGNGCETRLNSLTNCGSCGTSCSRANATATCSSGSCRISSCNSGWGNCDGNGSNGCETRLNSLTHCGMCGSACNRANASATCSTGSCRIDSCSGIFRNCNGSDPDGCETPIHTDSNCSACSDNCSSPETCSGGPTANICGCTPRGSCSGPQDCGTQPDGCGGTVNCGSCSGLDVCMAGMCTCVPRTSCTGGANCGTQSDGCSGTLNCGSCSGLDQCMAGMCVCVPRTSCTGGRDCGTQSDGCSGTLNCGTCSGLDQCMANMCVCVPRTSCTGGLNCGTQGDGCSGTLNCGTCTSPDTCGGGGTAKICGCTTRACAAGECGPGIDDGCGGTMNCGDPCSGPDTCGGGGTPGMCGN